VDGPCLGAVTTWPLNRSREDAASRPRGLESFVTLVRCPRSTVTPNGLLVAKVANHIYEAQAVENVVARATPLDAVPRYMVHACFMRTGEVAAEVGVNIQTLRYYERRGILPKPKRTSAGYRVYSSDAVSLLRFIKRAQELGFTLHEIEELLRLRNNKRATCQEVKTAAASKVVDIDAKIHSLKAMKRALTVLLASCDRNDRDRDCPILESLDSPHPRRG